MSKGKGKEPEPSKEKEKEPKQERKGPAFGAEMTALFRQGREDLHNLLLDPFPAAGKTREMGAPGTPTPGGVDRSLESREHRGRERTVGREQTNEGREQQQEVSKNSIQQSLESELGIKVNPKESFQQQREQPEHEHDMGHEV